MHVIFVPPTPIKINTLRNWLSFYPDKRNASLLSAGFSEGFHLGYRGPRLCRDSVCLSSATEQPNVVLAKLHKEIKLGRIAGPFKHRPFANLQCSPIGLVPKHDPGEFRLIHNLSFPSGGSINDFIDKDICTVHYNSFDTAVDLVASSGQRSWVAKSDIKSAFRLLPVAPSDYELLGFVFQGEFYYDKCLPMGCSISCSLFEAFSTFLEFQVKRVSQSVYVTHYLDDFLFVGESQSDCAALLQTFRSVCDQLGVPIAEEKTMGPSQVITYLGLEIDTIQQLVRVPAVKVLALRQQINRFLGKSKLSLREIQSLVGSLNFVCRAVAPGRAFTRRLIGLTLGLRKPHHKVRISAGAKMDLVMWLEFLGIFNGVSPFLHRQWQSNEGIDLFTDAAASIGFGGYFNGKWFHAKWAPELLALSPSIALLEFYPLVVAVYCWGDLLANHKVRFRCDNSAVVHIINKQTSRCDMIMHLVRLFVCRCLRCNIAFKAIHVPGVRNDIADSLSRFQVDRFRMAAPRADLTMTPLPNLPPMW